MPPFQTKSTVTEKFPTDDLVRIVLPSSMFVVLPVLGLPTVPALLHAIAEVNVTGVNCASATFGSPPLGSSIIHSTVSPLKAAPGGGGTVIDVCWPVD